MHVLSLFDGISCGRVALERAQIPVTKYYASEIDPYAVKCAMRNYPDTIQLGDINNWQQWDIEKPDLIMGGSPCQGFSFAGKQLAFDDPRSRLFFKFVAILQHYKPKYFLLENVRMKKEYISVISDCLGVEPVLINSSSVSAQNRPRLYWCNWPVTQPEDKGIVLKDIIEHGVVDKDKSYCIDASYWKGGDLKQYLEKHRRQLIFTENYLQWDSSGKGYKSQDQRAYYPSKKHGALAASRTESKVKVMLHDDNEIVIHKLEPRYRKLTPVECERLQTLDDGYTEGLSNTQRYKLLGNAWTVDVIAHLLSNI